MIYYFLLMLSAVIFAVQFIVTKVFQQKNGTGVIASIILSLVGYLTITIFFFVKGSISNGQVHFGFSWFTFLIGIAIAVLSFLQIFTSVQVLKIGDMSLYSVFLEIGNILFPSLTGMIIYKESVSVIKIIAIVIMIVAVVFSGIGVKTGKISLKAFILYILCMILNGLLGTFFTIHQNHPELSASPILKDGIYSVDNDMLMMWLGITTVLVSTVLLVAFIIIKRKEGKSIKETFNVKSLLWLLLIPVFYGLCNGIGNYFIAISTEPSALGSSIAFPIVDGGVIALSTLVGVFLYKEKLSLNKIISISLVIVSCILFMFA